jgi:activator of HSP90 ATPase
MSGIHQEVEFSAPASRVYAALVDAGEFAAFTGAPYQGEPAEGSGFTAFGGNITGRHLELVPGRRVVQAWRARTWPAGLWSTTQFELEEKAGKTRLAFDHRGFPEAEAEHLAAGWHKMYWEPLRKRVEGKA